jgi:cobalt/nickel transport system permease protein
MHMADALISPAVGGALWAATAAAGAVSARAAARRRDERRLPLMAVLGAFVFAAQMINFPIAGGGGTSGHFLGALLAAILLGPLNACLVMAVVLTIQCLLFQDGGLTALGSNLLNMGIVGGLGGYAVFRLLKLLLPRARQARLAAAAVAAWASVVMASAACAAELAVSGTSPARVVLPAMVGIHAIIGAGEAIITVAVLSAVLAVRPDLIGEFAGANRARPQEI